MSVLLKSTYHTTEPQPCVFPDHVSGKVFTLVFISCLISKTTIYLLPNVFSAETRAATSHLLRRPFLGPFRKMPVDYVTKRKWLTRHSHLLVLFVWTRVKKAHSCLMSLSLGYRHTQLSLNRMILLKREKLSKDVPKPSPWAVFVCC